MRRKTVKNLVTTAMVTALVLGGSTMVYAEELPVEVETEAALDEIAEAETETVVEKTTEVTEEPSVESETEAVLENNESDSSMLAAGGRTVDYYSLPANGGTWDGSHYNKADGSMATDVFFFDGTYTYYLMTDGTPMKDKLTYHPDGEHIVYFDHAEAVRNINIAA